MSHSCPSSTGSGSAGAHTSTTEEIQTCDSKKSRVVLLIGETGTGKSTFVNYLANYFLQGSLSKLKVVIPNKIYRTANVTGFENHSEASLDDVTGSQTRSCITYSFRRDKAMFRFIDTPGLSDTSNSATEHVDDNSINTILTAASQAGKLHAIVLIINGSASRLTISLRNALQRISGNYSDVFLNDMIVIYTNCQKGGKNFNESSLPFFPKRTFVMDNSAFCSPPSDWDEEDREQQELSWKLSMQRIKEIVDFIDQLGPQFTEVFQEVVGSRNAIISHILRASAEIQKQQTLIEVLTELKSQRSTPESKLTREEVKASAHDGLFQLLQHQETSAATRSQAESMYSYVQAKHTGVATHAQSASNYTTQDRRTYKETVYTSYHNTLCRGCYKTCHERCGLAFTNVRGDHIFRGCASTGNDLCRKCDCSYKLHIHEMYKLVEKSVWETDVDYYKKAEYELQTDRVRELERDVVGLENQVQAAQYELRTLEAQLANSSRNSEEYRAQELQIQYKKDAIFNKKKQAEAASGEIRNKKAEIETKLQSTDAELRKAETLLQKAQDTVKAKCVELKEICSRLNFVEELNCIKESLRTALSTLTTTQARESADAFISSLDRLANELTE